MSPDSCVPESMDGRTMLVRIHLLIAFVTLLVGLRAVCGAEPISITGPDEPRLAVFDQLMTSFIREHDVPGASLAIARHGQVIYARGFGYADVEKHEPVEPDSLFRIASISKPFT